MLAESSQRELTVLSQSGVRPTRALVWSQREEREQKHHICKDLLISVYFRQYSSFVLPEVHVTVWQLWHNTKLTYVVKGAKREKRWDHCVADKITGNGLQGQKSYICYNVEKNFDKPFNYVFFYNSSFLLVWEGLERVNHLKEELGHQYVGAWASFWGGQLNWNYIWVYIFDVACNCYATYKAAAKTGEDLLEYYFSVSQSVLEML